MEVLYSFINIPFILIIGVIVFILVLSNIHNKKLKIDLISSISISVIIMFASLFMMITFPPMIIIIIITIIVWITIQLFISFRNKLILLRNNKKEIYIRDIEVDYSPAVLFYLINNKLETKVVLPATILNLCANKIIKLEENQDVCLNCGKLVHEQASTSTTGKSKIVAGVLGILLGTFGIHNFYLGYTGKALAQLLLTVLTCGLLSPIIGIWGLIEGILILTGSINEDADGNELI